MLNNDGTHICIWLCSRCGWHGGRALPAFLSLFTSQCRWTGAPPALAFSFPPHVIFGSRFRCFSFFSFCSQQVHDMALSAHKGPLGVGSSPQEKPVTPPAHTHTGPDNCPAQPGARPPNTGLAPFSPCALSCASSPSCSSACHPRVVMLPLLLGTLLLGVLPPAAVLPVLLLALALLPQCPPSAGHIKTRHMAARLRPFLKHVAHSPTT